ncbi:low temperature requirement protein LtrA [Rhizoctonia solani AG-3 Rhs1AP]|uniref:Low temperature requirement protein LtrA n=2 Tax=Rhizoctonia solani AG-3 TaxID=1086053 RepID=A0A074S1T5_9AGAM|nr:low temperature requirement protein LtrA [Rhizoctonia solani AG-3 Rhs1AP]KEP51530.1 low temperature requirement protein LtrA [Rhizoctonia solani 123E]
MITGAAVKSGNYFRGIRGDVDPDDYNDGLTEQRLEQWRPLSQNPFTSPDLGLAPDFDQQHSVSLPPTMTHAGPTWVNLFYDLAWTASFASLTQNGQLTGPWDTVSYIAFFLVVWWLWASQTLYNVYFYINDWVHLLSIFAQLIIFGLLAATTRGYDVTAYIMHSPGISTLDPKSTIDDIVDPDRYAADLLAGDSLCVIALTLAINRTLLWAQHLLVLGYAKFTARKQNLVVPWKLYVLPIGLSISNVLFWAAMVVAYSVKGKTIGGAKCKFVLWGVGLSAEVLLHLLMEHLSWQPTSSEPVNEPTDAQNVSQDTQQLPELLNPSPPTPAPTSSPQKRCLPVPQSNVNLRNRLEGITTVILGEGINGIAGTLYAVISVSGFTATVAINIACAAIIVYFLAYFYFEGPTGRRDPKGSKGYISTGEETFRKFNEMMTAQDLDLDDSEPAKNLPLKNFLLKHGLRLADELKGLNASMIEDGTTPSEVDSETFRFCWFVWENRLALKIIVNFYKTFMGENEIAPEVQTMIDQYYNNITFIAEDIEVSHEQASSSHYSTIVSKLLEANLMSARYITGLAAVILISLGIMNRVHSKPRDPALDRFQWGIIFIRFAMGFTLLLLLLLNIGRYQSLAVYKEQEGQQAGVFLWITACWVLPTVTLTYVVEFVFEIILLRCAGLAIARERGRLSGPLWRLFFRKPLSWSSRAQ